MEEQSEKRKNKILNQLKKPHVMILIAILILAIVLRVWVFTATSDQALWWDEAEYMAKAKKLAYGWSWIDFWNPHKPILLSFMAVPFFFLGIGEIGIRFLILLLSVASVPLIYFPAKEFFKSKSIGVIASFLLAIFWVHIFFTGRILVGLPATACFLAFWYFFYKGFIKKENEKFLWLAAFFFGIAFMFRVVYGVIAIPILLYMIFEDKLKFFKNKNTWIALLILILTLLPMIFWLWTQYPADPVGEFLGFKHERFSESAGAMGWAGVPKYFKDIPYALGGQSQIAQWIFTLLFSFGAIIYFSDIFLLWDKLFKPEYKNLRIKLFILIFILFLFVVWGNTRAYVEQRDYLPMAVFIFGITGVGVLKLKDIIAKYNKSIAMVIIVAILLVGAYYQISWGRELTKQKSNDFYEVVKQAGLWIKANSEPGDIVYSTARKQMLYYAEREVLDPGAYEHGSRPNSEKPPGKMMDELMENKNIRFIEMDVVEKRPASEFLFNWIQNNQNITTPVNAWYLGPDKKATLAVVYEINR